MRTLRVTGSAGIDQIFGPLNVRNIRPAATLVGNVTVKRGAGNIETLLAGLNPNAGLSANRFYDDLPFDSTNGLLALNLANAGDVVLVFFS